MTMTNCRGTQVTTTQFSFGEGPSETLVSGGNKIGSATHRYLVRVRYRPFRQQNAFFTQVILLILSQVSVYCI